MSDLSEVRRQSGTLMALEFSAEAIFSICFMMFLYFVMFDICGFAMIL